VGVCVGVGVGVGVYVGVGVNVAVCVGADVGVGVNVAVGVMLGVGENVGADEGVSVDVEVAVGAGAGIVTSVGVACGLLSMLSRGGTPSVAMQVMIAATIVPERRITAAFSSGESEQYHVRSLEPREPTAPAHPARGWMGGDGDDCRRANPVCSVSILSSSCSFSLIYCSGMSVSKTYCDIRSQTSRRFVSASARRRLSDLASLAFTASLFQTAE